MSYHVVVGVDGSPHSAAALRWSLDEAQAHSGSVTAVLAWQVPVLVAIGAVVWAASHRDLVVPAGVVYLAMTLLWPYINERRVILVLPLVVFVFPCIFIVALGPSLLTIGEQFQKYFGR